MNKRIYIKYLIKTLLTAPKAVLDVKRVETNRPQPLLLEDCPVILVYVSDERPEIISGSEFIPHAYCRHLFVNIEIVTYQMPSADDFLDKVASQIEYILFGTEFLNDSEGIVEGIKLVGTKPFTFDDGADKIYNACQLQFEIPYDSDVLLDRKYASFEEYDVKFNKPGSTTETIDPTLIEAEGKPHKE